MALPPLIPLEVFFGNPRNVSPELSPDGKRIAYIAPDGGIMNVWVRTLGTADDRAVTRDRKRGIMMYFWSEDGRYLLYMQDKDGDENYHLYAVDMASGAERDLTPFPGVTVHPAGSHPSRPLEILVVMNRRDRRFFDVHRLRLDTGELTLEAENPGDVDDWTADRELRVRAAWATVPGFGFALRVRGEDGGAWTEVARFGREDDNSRPIGFTPDNRGLYLLDTRGRDTRRLVEMDLATGKLRTILSDPRNDVGGTIRHPVTGLAQASAVTGARRRWKVLDPALKPVFDAFGKAHHGDLYGLQRDLAEDVWLAGFDCDDGPAAYYLWDRKRGGDPVFLFHSRPELAQCALAKMKPVSFPARDGLTIHGYLTLPPGVRPRNLPLVLDVHGGPYHRDTWGYDAEAQWLANRGYAVLQVNFRGSTGYGKKFLRAAVREWGGKMHDDLIDGVNWAVAKGIADPGRLAIYGGSYGGYATLVGATFTPDVFRCAVAMCGPSNLLTFLRTIPPYWETAKDYLYQRIGDPDKDEEFLRSRSPLFHVDRIKIPMMIVQGANDPRVVQAESEQIVEALRRNGRDVEYLLFPDEGHGLLKAENRMRFYRAADAFLAKHLGGRAEGTTGSR